MAIVNGITIVTTNKVGKIDVDFGDYGDGVKQSFEIRYNQSDIVKVECFGDNAAITMRALPVWYLVFEENPDRGTYFWVESIDGTSPTSNTDLYDKLKALM